METSPDKHCLWTVTDDHLEESLNQIHKHGSTVTSVVPNTLEPKEQLLSKMKVTSYLIIYYNPPVNVIPGIGGNGDSATIQ